MGELAKVKSFIPLVVALESTVTEARLTRQHNQHPFKAIVACCLRHNLACGLLYLALFYLPPNAVVVHGDDMQ